LFFSILNFFDVATFSTAAQRQHVKNILKQLSTGAAINGSSYQREQLSTGAAINGSS
jgi:hypothetical protein